MDTQTVPIQSTMLIPARSCVTADGELANSGNPAHQGHVIGLTEGTIESGAWGAASIAGTIFYQQWTWTAGGEIYLNGLVLSQTPPGIGFVQVVGWALTPQSMLLNF